MSGPWEQYATKKSPSAGPWSQYQGVDAGEDAARKPKTDLLDDLKQGAGNLAAGVIRGAGSIGATILAPVDMVSDAMDGKGLSLQANRERRAKMDAGLQSMGAEPSSLMYQGGKLAGEIAGTAGAGGVLGNAVRAVAPAAAPFANALATGGFKAGTTPGVVNMLTRMAGGGVTGAVSAGMINPEDAWKGGAIGAALPPALSVAGKVGGAIGQKISGPAVSDSVRDAVIAARQAGYVIPPSQAKPTLVNRMLEGFSGKITTAQNASAKNQSVTNELAKKAIGAADLTPEGIAAVRSAANASYDDLARVGAFQSDDAFRVALSKVGAASDRMKADFPELVNSEVESLVSGLSGRGQFDSQSIIEAIKQFRFNGSANKIAQDPAKKALGGAQMKIAGALEDLVDRNLQKTGEQALLTSYRDARQTLAKVYDIERALNTTSGNVDAGKIAGLLKKGRPLTGELRDIGQFAGQFPKAAQVTEKMGSLPQVSPLDFGALGTMSALTSNPLLMAGVLARPAARSLVLSGAVQNRLAGQPGQNALLNLLGDPASEQMLYRSAPALATSR